MSRSQAPCAAAASRITAIVAAVLVAARCAFAGEALPAALPVDTAGVAATVGMRQGRNWIAYELPHAQAVTVNSAAGTVKLELKGGPALPTPDALPNNVTAVRPSGDGIEFNLVPGAQARTRRDGNRVILEVLDPPKAARVARPRRAGMPKPASPDIHAPPQPHPTAPGPAAASEPAAAAQAPAAPVPEAAARPVETPPPVSEPRRDAVQPVAPPANGRLLPNSIEEGPISVSVMPLPNGEAGAVLPFRANVGAAAFRRGDRAILVFDARQPLDFSQLSGDPVLGGAAAQLLPTATVVSFALAGHVPLSMERGKDGWHLRLNVRHDVSLPPSEQGDGEIKFALPDPGQVVVVPDPESSASVLVGTVNPRSGAGAAFAVSRRTPSFQILPAWLGLAVKAVSDNVQLAARTDGFSLHVPSPLLAPAVPASTALSNAASLTRTFDFPNRPPAALIRRMQDTVAAAAAMPARGRLLARVDAAQAMIALGLGSEAEGLLTKARAENPGEDQTRVAALSAIAALLDRRVDISGALDDPNLPRSDEINFWRAAAAAFKGDRSAGVAAALAVTAPLAASYPDAMRDKLLPLVTETLIAGGQSKTADALLAQFPNHPSLALARAQRLEGEGENDKALAAYDKLDMDGDRLVRVRAETAAAELRYRLGKADAAATAETLERLLVGWRGDAKELSLRLRVAELRTDAGKVASALEMLRDTQRLFPNAYEAVRTGIARAMEALAGGDGSASLKPLEVVALIKEFAPLLPDGAMGDRLATLLADRLVALDLPDQATPVLEQLMKAASDDATRARFGLQLATMRLEGGDAAAALAVLRGSDAAGLPPALAEERGLVQARAQSRAGDLAGATATLATLGTAAADDMRASLLEAAKDWPGALAALRDLAAKRVGSGPSLSEEEQGIVLREASAATQAGDRDAMLALRQAFGSRMVDGPRAELFRLLTGRPLQSSAELPKLARDVALARDLPKNLQGLAP